jgi:molybdate transport system substrate-binding protein
VLIQAACCGAPHNSTLGGMTRTPDIVVLSTPVAKFFLDSRANFLPKASIRYGLASELKAEIEQGASFDIALLTEPVIDDLIKQGMLTATSRIPVFKSGVGLAVRGDTQLPPVSSTEELKQALLQAKSVAIRAGGAGGAISKQVFERLGIAETMAAKTVVVSTGTLAEAIVNEKAELGLCQVSEIISTEGARLHAPLPSELQVYSRFAAAIATHTKLIAVAQTFMRELEAPTARVELEAKGLGPA